jgi:hypothetical protein
MTTAVRRRRPRHAATPHAGTGAPAVLGEFGREQFATVMDTSCAIFRGLEALRTIQQRTASETAARHRAAAHELRAAAAPGDLFAIARAVWQADLDAANGAWQALIGAALEAQTEILGCACSNVFDSETALEAASAIETLDALPGAALLLQPNAAARSAPAKR